MEGEKYERSKMPLKPHFVMIHGLCGGAWSWFKIKSLLETCSGFKATCLDLRGCGTDPTDGNTIQTFDEYNEPLDEFMAALPEGEKVALVGYSAGGLSVTKALHKFPNKIQLVIYIAATMLKFGFQTPEDLKIGVPDFSNPSLSGETEEVKQPPTHFKLEQAPKLLNLYCSLEDMTLAQLLARPSPLKALLTTFELTESESETSEKIPRVFIKTTRDNVLKPEQQEAMIRLWPPAKVYEIETDHCPLLSSPLLLSGFLLKAASSFTS